MTDPKVEKVITQQSNEFSYGSNPSGGKRGVTARDSGASTR